MDKYSFRVVEERDIELIYYLRLISKTDALKTTTRTENRNFMRKNISQEINTYYCFESEEYIIGYQRFYEKEKKIEIGSLITSPNATSLEKLKFDLEFKRFVFGKTQKKELYFDVNGNNKTVWRFHEHLGAKLIGIGKSNRHYVLTHSAFRKSYNKFAHRIKI